jgi:flagellar hook-basal body complex protein FliE
MVDAANIIQAYQRTAQLASGVQPEPSRSVASEAESFAALMKRVVHEDVSTLKAGEQISIEAMSGKRSVEELTLAVTQMDMTLRKAIAMRDRLVSAYQEIVKMPI